MGARRVARAWPGVVAGLACMGWVAGAAGATVTPLSDLLMPGATLFSDNGSVQFSDFSYIPTIHAPNPEAINIITDEDVPAGFKIQGPFQAVNGLSLDALLGFQADVVAAGGLFTDAYAELCISDAIGVGGDPPTASSFAVIERIDSLSNPPTTATLTVFDTATPPGGITSATVSLAGFGSSISVLKDIGVLAAPPDLGPTFAGGSLICQDFPNVPEPTTGLALLGLASVLLIRRR